MLIKNGLVYSPEHRFVKEIHIPLESAVRCAAENPLRSLGLYSSRGSIDHGKIADLLLLDNELNIRHIIHNGILL